MVSTKFVEFKYHEKTNYTVVTNSISSIYSMSTTHIKATTVYSAFVSVGWGFHDEVIWLSFVVLSAWLLILLLLTILGSLLRN